LSRSIYLDLESGPLGKLSSSPALEQVQRDQLRDQLAALRSHLDRLDQSATK
jgi:hypothetical protein